MMRCPKCGSYDVIESSNSEDVYCCACNDPTPDSASATAKQLERALEQLEGHCFACRYGHDLKCYNPKAEKRHNIGECKHWEWNGGK